MLFHIKNIFSFIVIVSFEYSPFVLSTSPVLVECVIKCINASHPFTKIFEH